MVGKVSFVTINVALQRCTCIHMMKTHYDTPKSVSFEVQQSMQTSYIVSKVNSDPLFTEGGGTIDKLH